MDRLKEGNYFVRKLNTKTCCFLCLQNSQIKSERNGESSGTVVTKNPSLLRCLARHLKINPTETGKVSDGSPIASYLITEKDKAEVDIEVDLCEICEKLINRFSILFEQLEKVQMEMDFCLGEIHLRISQSSDHPELLENYSKVMTSERETLSQLVFVDKLRKEIQDKSFKTDRQPQVWLTRTNVARIKGAVVKQEKTDNSDGLEDLLHDPDPVGPASPIPKESTSQQSEFASEVKIIPETTSLVKKESSLTGNQESPDRNIYSGKYHCSSSKNSFRDSHQVHPHQDSSHPKKQFNFDICNVVTFLKSDSQRVNPPKAVHWTKNRVTKMYECNSCKKAFKYSSGINRHFASVHEKTSFKCDICNEATFTHIESLKRHKKTCKGKKPNHKFKIKDNFESLYHTRNPETGIYHCKKCNKTAQNRGGIILHFQNVHQKIKYKCDICSLAVFTQASSLTAHKKTCRETLEKRLQRESFKIVCKLCGKRFANNKNFFNHRLVVHKNVGRYPCNLCEKKFKTSYNLKNHKNAVHSVTFKTFTCGFCDKTYNTKVQLELHAENCAKKIQVKIEPQDKKLSESYF